MRLFRRKKKAADPAREAPAPLPDQEPDQVPDQVLDQAPEQLDAPFIDEASQAPGPVAEAAFEDSVPTGDAGEPGAGDAGPNGADVEGEAGLERAESDPGESAPADDAPPPADPSVAEEAEPEQPTRRRGLFGRLRNALRRTGSGLVEGIADVFAGGKVVDADLIDELETLLLSADVGIDATDRILAGISAKLARRQLGDADAVVDALKQGMIEILEPVAVPLEVPKRPERPYVILMVGVNGAGKTTTIGKLTRRFQGDGHRVLLAAGDTFRAAAIEQLQAWGERNDVPVVAQHPGADSASVAFDALESATARGFDIVIADTAGRLHTQAGLMEELRKVHRVIGKQDPGAPHEVLLVLDAGTGQNAVVQAEQFNEAVQVSGIVLTKLDGTAKGGVIFSIAERLGLPIRYIGVGEAAEDLREFRAEEFVDALLARSR